MMAASEIKNTAKAQFPRTEWIRDGVGGVTLTSPSLAQASADPPPDLRVTAELRWMGSLGFLEWPAGSASDKTSARTRTTGVEIRLELV